MSADDYFMPILIVLVIAGVIGAIVYTTIEHKKMNFENFQTTIGDLNDEQKCLHICGFQYPRLSYYDQYKFCVEKCDRISERNCINE